MSVRTDMCAHVIPCVRTQWVVSDVIVNQEWKKGDISV